MSRQNATHLYRKPLEGVTALSPGQLTVARLYAQGIETAQIAEKLGITRTSVGNHRARILEKFGIGHHRQLVGNPQLMGEG